MNAVQARLARTALRVGLIEIAEICGVSHNTISRLENGEALKKTTLNKIQMALEARGITFLDDDGTGPGIRVKPEN